MHTLKKAVIWLMCLCMIAAVLPASVMAADNEYSITNGYITYTFNKKTGGFSIDTAEGHPEKYYDNNLPLLYKDDKDRSNGTSFVSVRIDDKDYIFGQDYSFFKLSSNLETPVISEEGRLITISWTIKDITVIKKIALSTDADSDLTGNAGIAFEVINNSDETHDIGIRLLLDTALGNSVDAPYVVVDQDISPTYVETEFVGDDVPSQIRNVDSLSNPHAMSYLMAKGWSGGEEPTKLVIGHWANIANTKYDYTADKYCDFTNYSNAHGIPDSAAAVYWEKSGVASGASFTAEMLYGVGNFSSDTGDSVGLDMSVTRVELNSDGSGYANDGIVDITVTVDNSLDKSGKITAALVRLSYNEEDFTTVDGYATETGYDIIEKGETKTLSFKLKAKPQAEICAGEIYVALTATDDAAQDTIETMTERSIILPTVGGTLPDVQLTSLHPGTVYYEGTKAVTVNGNMKAFDALSVSNGGWDLRLYHTTSDHTVLIDKKDISFLDDEYTAMSITIDEDLAIGEYEIVFEFTDDLLRAEFGQSIAVQENLKVSADEYYKLKTYGVIALVRTTEGSAATTDYDFFSFSGEGDYLKFYNGDLSATGMLNGETIEYNFGEDVAAIEDHEILLTIKGEFREMQRVVKDDNGNDVIETYWQANKNDGDIIINNILSYEGEEPLELYRGTANDYIVKGDGLLKVVNSINVWRSDWSITVRKNIIYSLAPDRASGLASNNIFQVELSLDGAGTMVQSLGGFLIDIYYGVFSSEWWDDGDGSVTYGIGFGGMVAIPIVDDSKKGKIGSQSGKARATGLTDGQVTAEITSVMYGEKAELENGEVVVEDIGFKGINTTVGFGLPMNMLGSVFNNNLGVAATCTINTIDTIYEVDFGIRIKLIECEAIIGFAETSVGGKAKIVPDRLEFYIRNGLSIPLGPAGPPAYITGLGGGIQNLADTIGGNYVDNLPPITVVLAMRLRVIKMLVGDFGARISGSGFELTGQLTINEKKEILDVNAGFSATWITPWSIKLYGNISVLDGIIQGGLTVTLSQDYFYGYIYAALYVPSAIPLIGGCKLASVEAAVSNKFIGANVEIIGFKVGVIYYWGEDGGVEFSDTVDLNPPVQASLYEIQQSDDVYTVEVDDSEAASYYGTNIHKLRTTGGVKTTLVSIASLENGYETVDITVSDAANQGSLLFALPYTGTNAPEADDLVLVTPDKTEITMVPSDGVGGGNFLTRTEEDGLKYIYISVTDKSLLENGTWTIKYASDLGLTPGAVSAYGIDDISEIETVGISYNSNDPMKLDASWNTNGTCEDAMSLDIYLTEDKDIVEKIKTYDNTQYSLGDNILHLDDVSAIQSGSAEIEIPDSFPSGTYYAVAMLATMNGAHCVVSADSFKLVNPNTPESVAGVSVSYGGNGNLSVEIEDVDNADYTDYLVEVVADNGAYLENNFNEYDVDDDEILIGKEAGLVPGESYHVNVKTLREEIITPTVGSSEAETINYYYGGNVVSSNSITIPELDTPELVSVEASFDTSLENITDTDITLTYTFADPVWLKFDLRGESISYEEEYKTVWEVNLTDLNDGDYYTDFTATSQSKDTATGEDFEGIIPDARIGFTIDSSAPVLSLSKREVVSLDDAGTSASAAGNVVFTDSDGNYTISGLTEVGAVVTVDGSTDGVTIKSDGTFEYSGTLSSGETDKQQVIKAVDKAGNSSELLAYAVNSNMSAVDRIVLVANGQELTATTDSDGNTQDPTILMDGVDTVDLIVRAYRTDGSYVDIPSEDIEWSVLYGKNYIALTDGTITALREGETAVKAKLPTATVTTLDGDVITAGLEAYTVVNVASLFAGYILSYNANGGYNAPTAVTGLTAGEYTLSTLAPSHDDANDTAVAFIGWSTSAYDTIYAKGDELPATVTSVTVSDNTTVYAVWGYDTDGNGVADATETDIPEAYTVTYDANGGSNAPEPETGISAGEHTLSTAIPTHDADGDTAVVFIGWSLNASDKIYSSGDEIPDVSEVIAVSDDTTVYAVWGYDTDGDGVADVLVNTHKVSYTIENALLGNTPEYITDGAGYETTISVEDGYEIESVTVTMNGEDITASAYDSANGRIVIDAVTGDIAITVTAAAVVIDTGYTVTYDANGGDNAPEPETGISAGEHTLSTAIPTHDADGDTAVIFIGWSLNASGTIYSSGDEIPAVTEVIAVSGDTTVYAVWGYDTDGDGVADVLVNTHKFTYTIENALLGNTPEYITDGAGYETTVSVEDGYAIETVTITMNGEDITASAYDSATGKIVIDAVTGDIAITVTAAAAVVVETYTVTYDANGGLGTMVDANSPYDSGSTVTVLASTFTRSNYKFSGWNMAADGSGTSYSAHSKFTITENVTLYAQWTRSGSSGSSSSGGSSSSTKATASPTTEPTADTTAEPTANPSSADTGVSQMLNTADHDAYMQGYGENIFAPDSNMTRAEAAMMFYRLLLDKDVEITKTFSDVSNGEWYTEAVLTLASIGIIAGYDDGTFAPDSSITRAEFTAIATRFANADELGDNIFSDVNESDWFYDYIRLASGFGWISGYPDGTFMPNSTITRAEVVTIVNRMLDRSADTAYVDSNNDKLTVFGDVSASHWAYYEIAEAANGHSYSLYDNAEHWSDIK